MQTMRLDVDADGVATLTFDAPGASVNTMDAPWQAELTRAVDALVARRDALRGVILASAKDSFFAGADLAGVMRLTAADAPAVFAAVEQVKRNFRRLETLGVPVVACLNGAALGGGWEVALAAHARIAVDDASTRFGTPEVTLGLIPGASGITKTVRRLGLVAAQPYLMEGRLFSPAEGLTLGLVDELVHDPGALRAAALAWIAAHPGARQPWDEKGHAIPGGTPASNPKLAQALTVAPALLARQTHGNHPAPAACLAAMVEGASVDFDTALRIESRHLARVMTHPVARNMIAAFFFDLNAVKAAGVRPSDAAPACAQRVRAAWQAEAAEIAAEGVPATVVRNVVRGAGFAADAALDATVPGQGGAGHDTVPDVQALKHRLLWRGAVEAARCLHEGAAASAAEANVASLRGGGFPAWTGGALRLVYSDPAEFFARSDALARRHGARFELTADVRTTLQRHEPHYD